MLEIKNLAKNFGKQKVLDGVELKLSAGEIGVLLGASGSGKTTLLRLIAGLERQDRGEIFIDGVQVPPSVPASSREIGFLFQSFALFPHLTASENVGVALRKMGLSDRNQRVVEVLTICGLERERDKYPHQMSGGQQQRLALARALAPRPRLLLMDEPFSSLDPELRARLGLEVRSLLKSQNVTSLIVTHQIDEAYDLADKIGVLSEGSIVQWATPYDLYHMPNSPFVAQHLERVSFLDVEISEKNEIVVANHFLPAPADADFSPGVKLRLLVRPDDIQHDDQSPIKARVLAKHFRGSWFLYELALGEGSHFYSYVPSHHDHAIGEEVGIRFELEHLILFPDSHFHTSANGK